MNHDGMKDGPRQKDNQEERPRAIGGRRNWRSAYTQIGAIAK
jgi:hypothetical protein